MVLSSSIALLNLILWNYFRLEILTGNTIHVYLVVSDWIVVFLFVTELIWNFILCEEFEDLLDSENLIVLLIIFEICWENLGQRDLVIFYFLHVFDYLIKSFRSLRVRKMRFVTKLFGQIFHKYQKSL